MEEPSNKDHFSILRVKAEAAVQTLKSGKSYGVDNIPAEPLKHGGEATINILTIIRNKIWQTGEWPKLWTKSLFIVLPIKGNLQLHQNYRTSSLINHVNKAQNNPEQNETSSREHHSRGPGRFFG